MNIHSYHSESMFVLQLPFAGRCAECRKGRVEGFRAALDRFAIHCQVDVRTAWLV